MILRISSLDIPSQKSEKISNGENEKCKSKMSALTFNARSMSFFHSPLSLALKYAILVLTPALRNFLTSSATSSVEWSLGSSIAPTPSSSSFNASSGRSSGEIIAPTVSSPSLIVTSRKKTFLGSPDICARTGGSQLSGDVYHLPGTYHGFVSIFIPPDKLFFK